jgi:Fe2+ or Zn2+ uptake regulation protein
MTHQRRVVLEEIRKTRLHLTADEIYARVRKSLPRVSIGTVYRNLEILAAQGLIHKIEQGHAQRRFDGVIEEHYHLTCTRCGKVEDAPIQPSDNVLDALENALGLLTKHGIFGHKLEFYGFCSRCIKREASGTEAEKEAISKGGQDETD